MAEGVKQFTVKDLQNPSGIAELNRMLQLLFDNIAGDTQTVKVFKGYGTPLNVVVASVGALYQRLDGGANTTLYVKESGANTAGGWVAK